MHYSQELKEHLAAEKQIVAAHEDEVAMAAIHADPQILEEHLVVEAIADASCVDATSRLAALNDSSWHFLETIVGSFDEDYKAFPKQFTDDYLSNHLYGQEARKVFIQHPRYNLEVFLKRTKDGRSILHKHWPKVAKTFNINEGSIFAFRFSSFLDDIHLTIYRL
ncbi:casein kinase i isoform delta-like protein [Hordeum vulgare]|nr:casein kinase i isoform delta-like protein [Hordeum vulgare]